MSLLKYQIIEILPAGWKKTHILPNGWKVTHDIS